MPAIDFYFSSDYTSRVLKDSDNSLNGMNADNGNKQKKYCLIGLIKESPTSDDLEVQYKFPKVHSWFSRPTIVRLVIISAITPSFRAFEQ
jgi:hypothetical protein